PLSARQRSRLLVRARPAVSRRRAAADRELAAEVARRSPRRVNSEQALGKLLADFRKRTECATLLAGERYSDYRETPPQCRGMADDEACPRVAKKRPRLRD